MRRFYVYSLMLVLVVVQVTGHTTLAQYTTIYGDKAGANPFWLLLLQDSSWNQTFGGTSNDYGYAIVEHSTGGFAIGGTTYSFDQGAGDFWLVKSDEDGEHQWNQSFGRSIYSENCQDIVECGDGGFALAGWHGLPSITSDALLLRTDSSGNQLWNQSFEGFAFDTVESLVELSEGGFVLAGSTTSYGAGGSDAWLIGTDASGNHIWNRTFGGAEEDGFHAILKMSHGLLMTGYTESSGAGSQDVFIVRTDFNGNLVWNQTFGGLLDDCGYESFSYYDGGFVIGAYTENFEAVMGDFWVIHTDGNGNHRWNQTYGGAGDDQLRSIVSCADRGFALFGYTNSFGAGANDFWLVRTDFQGNHHWNLTFGGPGIDMGMNLVYGSDEGFALTGYTDSYGSGGTDAWLVWVEDDPPPPPSVPIPGFPLEGLVLGLLSALGLTKVTRKKRARSKE